MKKLIYTYVDDIKDVKNLEELGFEIEFDDNSFYCEIDLSDFDLLNVLSVCDDCISLGIDVVVEIDNKDYFSEKDYDKIDLLVSEDPFKI